MTTGKCKVTYKGEVRSGEIVEVKLDKLKVNIFDKEGNILHTDWFQNNEIKRVW